MADEYEARTFVGDRNPPPDFSKAATPTSAPARGIPLSEAGTEGLARAVVAEPPAAPASSGEVYRVMDSADGGPMDVYVESPDLTVRKWGVITLPDARHVLDQEGVRDGGSWMVPKKVLEPFMGGQQPWPDFIKNQWGIGVADWISGEHGRMAMTGESTVADARAKGDANRQLNLERTEAGSKLRWSEAPLGKSVATARWAVGEVARMGPSLVDMAGGGAQGAAITGAGGLAMVLGAGMTAPVAIPIVVGMMTVGATFGAYKHIADNQGGKTFLDMLDAGFSEKTARVAAPITGAVVGALSVAQFGVMTAPAKRLMVNKVLTSKPVMDAVVKYAGGVVIGADIGGGMALATAAINDFAARVDNKPELINTPEEIRENMKQATLVGLATMPLIMFPGAVLEGAVGLHGQRARVRQLKAAVTAGELEAKNANPKMVLGEEVEPGVSAALGKMDGMSADKALEYGKANSDNADVKAALHAKSEVLKIQKDAISEGVKPGAMFPEEVQKDLTRIVEETNTVNQIAAGMEEGMKLSAEKRTEPMVPVKEPKTPTEAAERRYTEQEAVLKTLSKDSAALDKELTNLRDEQTSRLAEGKSVTAINAAMDKIAGKIRENDAKGAEIVMTPLHSEEALAMDLMDSGAQATISAAELIRMERGLVEKVAAAKESGRIHGEAYAKREVHRVQTYIQELVKRSGMTAAQKEKFTSILRNTQTVEQLEKNYPEIRDRIFEAEDVTRAKAIASLLKKGLKSGKVKSVNGKPQGRFGDADTQAIVNDVARIVKTTRTDAALSITQATTDALNAADAAHPDYSVVNDVRAQYRLKAALYRAGQLSTKESAAFVTDLVGMMDGAKSKYMEKKLAEEKAWVERRTQYVKSILGEGAELPPGWDKRRMEDGELATGVRLPRAVLGGIEYIVASPEHLGHLLGQRSGEHIGNSAVDKLWHTGEETVRESAMKTDWAARRDAAQDRVYKFEGSDHERQTSRRKNWMRLLVEHDLGEHVNAKGQKVPLKMTIGQAIKWYEYKLDPTLERNLTAPEALAYTPAMEAEIMGLLSDPRDRQMAEAQLQLYRETYKDVNPTVRQQRGVDLPYNPNYSPVSVLNPPKEFGKEVAPDASGSQQIHPRSTAGHWMTSRVDHGRTLDIRDSFSTAMNHDSQLIHYIAWEAKVREWNRFLSDPEIRASIIGVYGRGVLHQAEVMVQRLTAGGHERVIMAGANGLISRLVTANVLFKPIMAAKQLSTMPAFTLPVPPEHLHLYFGNMAKIAKEGFSKEWVNSDFVRSRGWSQTPELEALRRQVASSNPLNNPAIVETGAAPFVFGDKASILIGGDALYRYLKSQGKTTEEAIKIASDAARTTQSSGQLSELSALQGTSGWSRVFTAYLNQPTQLVRLELDAMMAMASKGFAKGEGRMGRVEAIQTMFIVHFVLPMAFQSVSDFGWDPRHQKRAAILGSFNSLPAWSNMLANIYDAVAEMEARHTGMSTVIDSWQEDILKAFRSLHDVNDPMDFVNALALFADPAFKALWGIPTKPFVNAVEAGKKVSHGGTQNYSDAFKLGLGYSQSAVKEQRKRGR